uniref:Uncharacterized protein n=1 Tax=Anguilla anguilla TaxID=7936 RepID=A0A0E9STV9_ANGAN
MPNTKPKLTKKISICFKHNHCFFSSSLPSTLPNHRGSWGCGRKSKYERARGIV